MPFVIIYVNVFLAAKGSFPSSASQRCSSPWQPPRWVYGNTHLSNQPHSKWFFLTHHSFIPLLRARHLSPFQRRVFLALGPWPPHATIRDSYPLTQTGVSALPFLLRTFTRLVHCCHKSAIYLAARIWALKFISISLPRSPSAKINFSYSILFHLIPSYYILFLLFWG